MSSLSVIAALFTDRVFGEVPRGHPLVLFGHTARRVEQAARRSAGPAAAEPAQVLPAESSARLRELGLRAWCLLVIPPTVSLWLLQRGLGDTGATLLGILVLYFCVGGRSLAEHARAVAGPLCSGDLAAAREQLSRIVSRDTAALDAQAVTKATMESVLENGSDAVLAPIFWFVVAGAPGALCYRLSNTLDAMWGYRNPRYIDFGRAAARIDDALNWLPARCCALSYALVGDRLAALRCWRTQAPLCDSPNAGPVMAAGAGALGVELGGATRYDGVIHQRPVLGEGRAATPADIARALQLVYWATGLWVAVIFLIEIAL